MKHERKTEEKVMLILFIGKYQLHAKLSHKYEISKDQSYCCFRGPHMSFLLMIYLSNNHNVAVWHSNCKCVFISLEQDDS